MTVGVAPGARHVWPRVFLAPSARWRARGLSALLYPMGERFVDAVGQARFVSLSGPTPNVRQGALGVYSSFGNLRMSGIGQGQTFSRIALVVPDGLATGTIITSTVSGSTNGSQWRITAGGEHELLRAAVVSIGVSSNARLAVGKLSVVGVTYDGTTARFFADGNVCGSGSSTQTFTIDTGSLFGRSDNTESINATILGYAEFAGRVLTIGEMASLTGAPGQLFEEDKPASMFFFSAASGGTTNGVGASVGVATASATSQATWAVVGASTAAPTVSATSRTVVAAVASSIATAGASSQSQALWAGVGTSVGTSDALADGIDAAAGITAAVGASAGAATASATARAVWAGVGASVGAATALATGTDAASGFAEATGSSVGTSTAAATGRSVWAAAGATPGGPDALGVSQSIHFRTATSTGVATATADGTEVSAYEPRSVTSAGSSLAEAVSRTVVAAVGTAAGSAVALATSDVLSSIESGVGVAVAAATAAAVAQAVWAAVGASTGSSTAEGFPPTSLPAGAVLAQIVIRSTTSETQVRLNPTTIYVTV